MMFCFGMIAGFLLCVVAEVTALIWLGRYGKWQ